MNKQQCDILNELSKSKFVSQRILAEETGYSLGIVNKSLKLLTDEGYIDKHVQLTLKANDELANMKPKRSIILAAGFGMRMVPINTETPKGLLQVNGEPLIERTIKYLHEVGIYEIYVVVGFMKERYEYLIDEFDVRLVFAKDYATKNNLHSLYLLKDKLDNSYIIPCDIWCNNNVFNRHELYSWYMVSDLVDDNSDVRVNRKGELVSVGKDKGGNTMIGFSYLTKEDSESIKAKLEELASNPKYDNSFWEESLYKDGKMIVSAKVVHSSDVVEINTYEQLRELDEDSDQLKSDAIMTICKELNVDVKDIVDITVLKKGMTNRSFLFKCNNQKYIMRIPGEGTDQLINRKEEADVYKVIKDKDICDDIIYINPNNGYKITKFIENARVCNIEDDGDLKHCMKRLRDFHNLDLKIDHEFNIFEKIDFYESLWGGNPSIYKDYEETKENVLSLKNYIDSHIEHKCLTHVDAVPDNFLITDNDIRLIDWEYAGMQDPHVDIAMFCIYTMYDRGHVNNLIDIYFENHCTEEIRTKIYCYIASCGLLWSNWCEYKRNLGVDFGEYSLRQYRYAKEYYRIVKERLGL